MATRGITRDRMATMRGVGAIGTFDFAPTRTLLAEYAEVLDDDQLRQRAASHN